MPATEFPANVAFLYGVAWWLFPFIAYFFGIFLNHRLFRSHGDRPLVDQYLMGLPTSLIAVTLYIKTYLSNSLGVYDPTYTITIGVMIFNGMAVTKAFFSYKSHPGLPPSTQTIVGPADPQKPNIVPPPK